MQQQLPPPYQQRPMLNQRPLTYGEYRKFKEDYERRFMPTQPISSAPAAAEISSPDASAETTQTTSVDVSITDNVPKSVVSTAPSYSKRDPRRQPKDVTPESVASMPPDHSTVAAGKEQYWTLAQV